MAQPAHVRRATAEDIPLLVRHRRLMFESMGFLDSATNDKMSASFKEYLNRLLPGGEYTGWIATIPERGTVGSLGAVVIMLPASPRDTTGRKAYLLNLYVEPQYRSQGIAHRLLEESIRWSREQGLKIITLHASDMGRPVYEGMGFKPTNEMRLILDAEPGS